MRSAVERFRVMNSLIVSVISLAFSTTPAAASKPKLLTSLAACIVPAAPPPAAAPPIVPTNKAFNRRRLASASVKVGSMSIRFRMAISSWITSAPPSNTPLLRPVPRVASAKRPITEFGPADFFKACCPISFNTPTSPNTPTAAWGNATNPARIA